MDPERHNNPMYKTKYIIPVLKYIFLSTHLVFKLNKYGE